MRKITLSAGQRYGRLVVVGEDPTRGKFGAVLWIFTCDCGETVSKSGSEVQRGLISSCGCLHIEVCKDMGSTTRLTHGKSHTPEFLVWCGMRDRCFNDKRKDYKDYGGRGITVCPRWLGPHGFENFLADMGPRPSAKHSIDRYPNNDDGYKPGNCRWATQSQQNLNQRPRRRAA